MEAAKTTKKKNLFMLGVLLIETIHHASLMQIEQDVKIPVKAVSLLPEGIFSPP